MRTIVLGMALISLYVVVFACSSGAQTSFCPPQMVCPHPVPCPPPQAPQPVAKTIDIKVPVPYPPHQVCLPHVARCGSMPPCVPQSVCRHPKPSQMPVRVEVSIRPEKPCDPKLVPLRYRDPGPIRPVVEHTVGFIGSAIALPFRTLEMFVGRCKKCPPKPCAPLCMPAPMACGPRIVKCGPPTCPPPVRLGIPTCGPPPCPPPCPIPMSCVPTGPSVGPLPCTGPYQPCSPNIPPEIMRDACEFPPLESKGLLSGAYYFPGRLLQRGRFRWRRSCGGPPPPCGSRY